MAFFDNHSLAFLYGILGNIISFLVYMAPMPTFYRICRNRSTYGFHSFPYVVALFSSMLWVYYAIVKTHMLVLITINAFGCVIETAYIVVFVIYASRDARIFTAKVVLLLNVGLFSLILLLTLMLAKGECRIKALGFVCVAFSVAVFASPLSIITRIIRTRSVEYMPFSLTFCLTLSAVTWLMYGLLMKDYYIALPNILGIAFGVVQIILYAIYKNKSMVARGERNREVGRVANESINGGSEVHPIDIAEVQRINVQHNTLENEKNEESQSGVQMMQIESSLA